MLKHTKLIMKAAIAIQIAMGVMLGFNVVEVTLIDTVVTHFIVAAALYVLMKHTGTLALSSHVITRQRALIDDMDRLVKKQEELIDLYENKDA